MGGKMCVNVKMWVFWEEFVEKDEIGGDVKELLKDT
jgi:hypothetical protein